MERGATVLGEAEPFEWSDSWAAVPSGWLDRAVTGNGSGWGTCPNEVQPKSTVAWEIEGRKKEALSPGSCDKNLSHKTETLAVQFPETRWYCIVHMIEGAEKEAPGTEYMSWYLIIP